MSFHFKRFHYNDFGLDSKKLLSVNMTIHIHISASHLGLHQVLAQGHSFRYLQKCDLGGTTDKIRKKQGKKHSNLSVKFNA